ncbi:MAG: helix-turn-helix domain-containing protein [Pseudonocardiaceae bacterium]
MTTDKTPNHLLAAVMTEARISNKGLAARVRALAQRDGHPTSSDHVSVRRWLDGSMPRGRTARYIAAALGAKLGRQVSPGDLGLTDTDPTHETEIDTVCDPVEISQRAWRHVRHQLIWRGNELFEPAARLYEPSCRLPQAPELSQASWLPDDPIALEDVELEWEPDPQRPIVVGQEPEARSLLPLRTRSQAFPSYSSAIRYLNPPELFENRPCYRLLGASLRGPGRAYLRFGQSCFFDKIDVAEVLAHEFCAAVINATPSWPELPFRSLISDPFDLGLRTVNTSINTLTIRHEADSDKASFFLLRRNPANVVSGGGLYCLVPAGEFQPASVSPESLLPDLCMWRNIVREYSEELLGQPEHDGSSGRPLDYEFWPFFRAMQKARENGKLRVYVLGVTLNSLSLNAAIITVAVIDSMVFDALFHGLNKINAEGEVVVRLGDDKEGYGLAFDEATVNHLLHGERLASPNVMAALSLAWRHRAHLLQA